MRLARFDKGDGTARAGIVAGDQVIDLSRSSLPSDTVDLIAVWDEAAVVSALAEGLHHDLTDVRLLAPLVPSRNVMAVGLNYREHVAEFSDSSFGSVQPEPPGHPVVFTKAATSVVGPDDPIVLDNDPTGTTDYEGEMAVVIGRPARNVDSSEALHYIFGWTIVNDVTSRELQKLHGQWFIGKSPDTFCPIGPWIVTTDELPRIEESRVRTFVNGELRQESSVSALIHTVGSLVASLTRVMTLRPGDVIATGTPSGVGIGFDPPRYLESGDVVEIEVDGIGKLRNPVI